MLFWFLFHGEGKNIQLLFSNLPQKYGHLSVSQCSFSVVSDSLWPHELQHTRPLCPSPTSGVYSTMSIESVMPSNHLILCPPLLLLPPIPPSIRVFSRESTLHTRWPKYWSFSFSISPSNEHRGLIFRMDWLDLLAVQVTLKSLLQHHSSKASIFRHFTMVTCTKQLIMLTPSHQSCSHWAKWLCFSI